MQAALLEKEEALKSVNSDKARLEHEAAGFSLRLKTLDESEQRYKDENWNLETQTHELIAAAKEAATREQKLQQNLASLSSEKNAAQRDLDELKQSHGKLVEDHDASRKMHESELAGLRKNVNSGENEKSALQRKIEDLTSQNQELARAVAGRFRDGEADQHQEEFPQLDENPADRSDVEHSPPPSPSKGVARHSLLESETLKSSLHHAHRMIQNLKSNIQREKSEKLDLKRQLQDARDELDVRKGETRSGHDNKRLKPNKSQQDLSRKQGRPNMLGARRYSKTDVMLDDGDWEDREGSPLRLAEGRSRVNESKTGPQRPAEVNDADQTGTETEDGFETANERNAATDTDNFETGAESMAGDSSDELTETEAAVDRAGTVRGRRPLPLSKAKPRDRNSFQSTASTSADEDEARFKTPLQAQPQRYRLKINRGSRRSQVGGDLQDNSNPSTAKNSPASFIGAGGQAGQSLFNELGDLNGADSGEDADTPSKVVKSHKSTPSMSESIKSQRSLSSMRRSVSSRRSSSAARPTTILYNTAADNEPPVPRLPLVDSVTMTEPWEPTQAPGGSNGSLGDTQKAAPSTPHQRGTSEPSGNADDAESAPQPTSVSPRTIWDQPLQMFSGIIPTFGPASHQSTPLSTRSATIRERGNTDADIESATPAVSPPRDTESGQGQTAELQATKSDETQREKVANLGLALSQISSVIDTTPSMPVTPAVPSRKPPSVPVSAAVPTADPDKGLSDQPINSEPEGDDLVTFDPTLNFPKPPSRSSGSASGSALGNSWAHPNGLDGILGPVLGNSRTSPQIAEDETSRDFTPLSMGDSNTGKRLFQELPANTVQRNPPAQTPQEQSKVPSIDMADEASQTILSADHIDSLLNQSNRVTRPSVKVPATLPVNPILDRGATSPPKPANNRFETGDLAKGRTRDHVGKVREPTGTPIESMSKEIPVLTKGPKRPISNTSIKSRTGQYPPLPPDHQQAIAAATQKTPDVPTGVMGPPGAPASSYRNRTRTPSRNRAPSTPNDQRVMQSPSSKGGTTPRVRYSTSRSQISRRSSVSSFASEIDERFNIRLDGVPGMETGTDPRMIQAITQTMIGEFLWKYTRKAGRGDMSTNRHRRFFWVHPYTRTLYWSDHDPSTAGRAQLKAKSVAIEAVRVVTDDNPMPPGLHRKSLVIMTPGRSVKLTATTGQRHETWFNALSYLLLRTGPNASGMDSDGGNLTADDIAEFNPSYNNRASSRSRLSLASWRSRRTSDAPEASFSSRRSTSVQPQSGPPSETVMRNASQSARQSVQPQEPQPKPRRGSLSSRISEYWKPSSVRGSISSRHSRSSVQQAGITSANDIAVEDSTEDLRRVIEHVDRQQQGVENVRACCDGESTGAFGYPS